MSNQPRGEDEKNFCLLCSFFIDPYPPSFSYFQFNYFPINFKLMNELRLFTLALFRKLYPTLFAEPQVPDLDRALPPRDEVHLRRPHPLLLHPLHRQGPRHAALGRLPEADHGDRGDLGPGHRALAVGPRVRDRDPLHDDQVDLDRLHPHLLALPQIGAIREFRLLIRLN